MNIVIAILVFAFPGYSSQAAFSRTIKCDDSSVVKVAVKPQVGARINFPVKPDDVVFGGGGMFSVKYVKNDIHVSPTSSAAHTNMTVYFLGRSCTFKLSASSGQHDELIFVKDADAIKMKAKFE